MLSQRMIDCLNQQINLEMYSSHLYLQMGSWCAHKGLDGSANFLMKHADEESLHMHKLLGYINETGALAVLGKIEAPPSSFNSFTDIFEKIYEHEKFITSKINDLVHLAYSEPDYSTLQFLQWYVAEQHQEEFLFKNILDKIRIIGTEGQGLFLIDRAIGEMGDKNSKEITAMSISD